MEAIYPPENFHASEPFDAKQYFAKYGQICPIKNTVFKDIKKQQLDLLEEEMDVPLNLEDLNALEELCSIEKLKLVDENEKLPLEVPEKLYTRFKIDTFHKISPAAKLLETIKCKEVLDQRRPSLDIQFGNKKCIKTAIIASNKSLLNDIIPGSQFIYSIIVYQPYLLTFSQKRNSSENIKFSFEIEALGSNTLADIADNISCISDVAIFKEVENTKEDLKPYMNARDKYPSRFLFINDTFYNDLRNPNATDYSPKITQWALEKGIGHFKTDKMETTRLDSLKPRLGYPYVYIHQGECEHIFTFSDARLIQDTDCRYSKRYPRMVAIRRGSNILCFICGISHSKWIVVDSERFPQDKVFLCTHCCDSYMYLDGKKIGDFKLYPYYDNELLTRHLDCAEIDDE